MKYLLTFFHVLLAALLTAQVPDSLGIHDYVFVHSEPKPINYDRVRNEIGYPTEALKQQIEGKVFCRILVNEEGNYVKHKFTRTAHPFLQKAVSTHIDKMRFIPAMRNRRPTTYWANVFFTFSASRPFLGSPLKNSRPNWHISFQGRRKSQEAFQQGMHYSNQGKWKLAQMAFDKSLQFQPSRVRKSEGASRQYLQAYYEKGKSEMEMGEWDMAFTSLTEAVGLSLEPEFARWFSEVEIAHLYLTRAEAYLQLNQPLRALDDCNWVLKQSGDLPYQVGYCHRAYAFLLLGKHQAAFMDVQQALEMDPSDPMPFFYKGLILADLEGVEAANTNFQKALALGLDGLGQKRAEILLQQYGQGGE
jgi:lipoprotein NlpI